MAWFVLIGLVRLKGYSPAYPYIYNNILFKHDDAHKATSMKEIVFPVCYGGSAEPPSPPLVELQHRLYQVLITNIHV